MWKMITHEMAPTTRQETFKHACRFAIHTLQSLLYNLDDLSKLGHVFIEYLYVLERNGPEHSLEGGIFRERITYRCCTCGLFVDSLVYSVGQREEKIKGEVGDGRRNRERVCPSIKLKTISARDARIPPAQRLLYQR